MMDIKIYGFGWVGKAMKSLFPDARVHDPAQGMLSEKTADIAFICVPTPNVGKGKLDTSIVEDVIKNSQEKLLVIRSTVNPGDCVGWMVKYKKNIVFQPEYLGETTNHPMTDQHSRPFIVLGGQLGDCRKVIELYQKVYNANVSIRQMTAYEAEVVKLTENRAIMYKVAQCQELYDACEAAGIDYYNIREAVYGDDPRFNLWFSFIYPEARGANSKCIPKDVYAWSAWAESLGVNPELTNSMLKYNEGLIND